MKYSLWLNLAALRRSAVLLIPLFLIGCTVGQSGVAPPSGSYGGEVTVFAAASLTEAFTELGQTFEKDNPSTDVVLNFAGSTTLRAQLEQGATADVFASANEIQMDLAVRSGSVEENPLIFVTNHLVVVTPLERETVRSLIDLGSPGVKLVLALPEVPAGSYSRQSLAKMGSSSQFPSDFVAMARGNVVSEEINVRQVSAKVALGEADAGLVYATDVTPDMASRLQVLQIPTEFNVVARYPIAPVSNSANPPGAKAFVEFVLSAKGQEILSRHGFGAPPQ